MKEWFNKIPVEEMIAWRRHIHQHPEVSFKEYQTAAFVEEKLRSFGNIEIKKPTETSVLGILKGDHDGKVIALRADMDALPMQEESGLSFQSQNAQAAHTCGHDTHTAMLLATAKVLSQLTHVLHGTVLFIFQHAEELHPGGAKAIMESGMLDGADAIVGLHIFPNLKTGSIHVHPQGAASTAADGFYLTIQGVGSHGSMPQMGIDPIMIGVQIINELQIIISRFVTPGELAVISIGEFKAGNATNIIPDKAYMSATVRTVSEETRQAIAKRIKEIIDHTCAIYGATYDLNYELSYPAIVNDQILSAFVMDSAREVVGDDMVFEAPLMSASEDFSYYRTIAPISFILLGGGTASEGCGYANHHPKFTVKEEALLAGVKTEVQCVLNYLK